MPHVFVEKYTWLVLTWLACQAAADLVICSAMVFLLNKCRTGFRQCVNPFLLRIHVPLCFPDSVSTDTTLNIMTLWTINTGVITALASIAILVAVGF